MTGQILRTGVDSLYLSYSGQISQEWQKKLEEGKECAQSEDRRVRAQAQIDIGGTLYKVYPHGSKPFAYVFENNLFYVRVSRRGSVGYPMVQARISSEVLTRADLVDAVGALRFIVGTLGEVSDSEAISRVDLCVDFVTEIPVDSITRGQWIGRARNVAWYADQTEFTGWAIGQGGPISARLYDKTIEIKKSGKDYLKEIWLEDGWNGADHVWRMEFQLLRAPLVELGIKSIAGLKGNVAGLWQYLTEDWLRLTVAA